MTTRLSQLFLGVMVMCGMARLTDCFNLTILHTNDVHARFQPERNFGGAARRMTALKKLRSEHINVLLVDGGDQFQGTIWYTLLKWEPIAQVMNALKYDAMAFGNHEFDDGLEGLEPFIKEIQFPVINSNIDATGSILQGKFKKYHIKELNGERIGIIGYTTTETPELSKPGPHTKFQNEIATLRNTVKQLQQLGINKIIAIGHAGISMDRKICREVAGVDVVVGGHTNTFLYTGEPPSTEVPEGPYPEVFQDTGSPCLVVQDYAFGKYLGFLQVQLNGEGVVKAWSGNPILLDRSWKEDAEIAAMLKPYADELEVYKADVIAKSAVALDGDRKSCRLKECNLGNMVVDSMVHAYYSHKIHLEMKTWTPAAIGIINGGAVRDFTSEPGKSISLADIYSVLPFMNTVEKIHLKGKYLLEALEHSVKGYHVDDSHGKFLQVSGLKVVYDLSMPDGRRVQSVLARCADCAIPRYAPLDPQKTYKIVTISYLIDGGDGYSMVSKNMQGADGSEMIDIDVVSNYIKGNKPIVAEEEGRILFANSSSYLKYCPSDCATSHSSDAFSKPRYKLQLILLMLTSLLATFSYFV